MSGMYDGLGGEKIQPSGLQAGSAVSPFFAGSITSASQISGLNVFGTGSVIGGKLIEGSNRVSRIGIGSPSTYHNAQILCGSGALSAGSVLAVSFQTPFSAIPVISVGPGSNTAVLELALVHYGTGSMTIVGDVASTNVMWSAIGTA